MTVPIATGKNVLITVDDQAVNEPIDIAGACDISLVVSDERSPPSMTSLSHHGALAYSSLFGAPLISTRAGKEVGESLEEKMLARRGG